jgi:hypothetical protein
MTHAERKKKMKVERRRKRKACERKGTCPS